MSCVKNHELAITAATEFRPPPRKPGILIADDQGLILTLLKYELEPRGFIVWLAVDGDDALDLYRRNIAEIDLVLLDVQMPGLDGPQTLAAIKRFDPDVLACFMTGGSRVYTDDELMGYGAARIFRKPLHLAEIALCLRKLMESANSSSDDAQMQSRGRTRPLSGIQ